MVKILFYVVVDAKYMLLSIYYLNNILQVSFVIQVWAKSGIFILTK